MGLIQVPRKRAVKYEAPPPLPEEADTLIISILDEPISDILERLCEYAKIQLECLPTGAGSAEYIFKSKNDRNFAKSLLRNALEVCVNDIFGY